MQKKKIRIVIADDQSLFRDGLCRLLTLETDFEVLAQASNGYQALNILQQYEPDILLVDLKMPRLGGLATLQRLQLAEKQKPRVIVLTASGDKKKLAQAMRLGASGIVMKQTAAELLIKGIRKVYAGEIWVDPQTTLAVSPLAEASDAVPRPQNTATAREGEGAVLNQREREIVALAAQGFKNKEMAERLFISIEAVCNHLSNIFDKLGVSDRLELALYGLNNEGLAGSCVVAGGGKPRLPHRPPLSASAAPPADPYGNWVTEIPSDPKKSNRRRK